jgi:hypothetical protein
MTSAVVELVTVFSGVILRETQTWIARQSLFSPKMPCPGELA